MLLIWKMIKKILLVKKKEETQWKIRIIKLNRKKTIEEEIVICLITNKNILKIKRNNKF